MKTSRRNFLNSTGLAAGSLLVVGGASTLAASEPATNRHKLSGIDRKNLVDDYARRALDELDDADLCRQAAAIISNPPAKGFSSFSLHAPLELLARYGLLPLVNPRERTLARLQLAGSAASF